MRSLAALAREDFSVSKQIAMYGCRKFDRQLHGFIVRDGTELEFRHVYSLSFVWLKHQVTVDDDTHRETWPDCERRLNVEVPSDNLLSGLIERIGGPMPERLKNGRAGSSVGARSKL